jgi:hypothetical protein
MTLDLDDVQTIGLAALLRRAINDDRFPLSLRVKTWQAIRDKIEPRRVREPLPEPNVYAPPRAGRRCRG